MKVIIPAAGYATRLYPLTKNKPKSLIEVKGKTILEHIFSKLEEIKNIDQIYIVTNSKFYTNFDYFLDEINPSKPVKIINDHTETNEDRLGTIGDIQYVIKEENIQDDLLIINGDNLFNFSLKDIFEKIKKEKTPFVALYDVKTKENAKKYGVVETDKQGKIIGFQEKPEQPKTTLISTGIYYFPNKIIPLFKSYLDEGNIADAPGNFLQWLHKKETVKSHTYKKKWFDIGSFESLGEARREFEG